MKSIGKIFVLLLFVPFLFSCGEVDVKPWEKETLAKDTMSMEGTSAETRKFLEHIYFSKEGTKGGSGVTHGGCGCN